MTGDVLAQARKSRSMAAGYRECVRLPYQDPADLIWLRAAQSIGWTVERSTQVFASFDGKNTLRISTVEDFDPDDCLAQMILHEICHALVQGPEKLGLPDYGMENIDDSDLFAEYACHRLQAALLHPFGLRVALSPTTDHRPYYLALPVWPCRGEDAAAVAARAGLKRARQGPWAEILTQALSATADLADAVRHIPGNLWSQSLARHPLGLPPSKDPAVCTDCAWGQSGRCLVADQHLPELGCAAWEPVLSASDCGACGACCRQGFDVVDLEPDSPLLDRADVVDHGFGPQLPRPGGYCVALTGEQSPYRCGVYSERPKSCRDLAPGSEGCLAARQRCGLPAGNQDKAGA